MDCGDMYLVEFRVTGSHGEMVVTIPWADKYGSHAKFSHPIPREQSLVSLPAPVATSSTNESEHIGIGLLRFTLRRRAA